MKVKTILLSTVLALVSLLTYAQNGKKVYADYHGTRYTRPHDGMLGRWSYYLHTGQFNTPIKSLNYNADIILENGRHDIASVNYPLVGIQSAMDEDYIEYQILSAKTAGIDGFFIEWGYPEHESNFLLKAMQRVAGRYNFEIGVNWCDGWLYYDWITKQVPSIKTREDKTQHFFKSLQYLTDSVFSVPTAPLVKDIPVAYLFGGITSEEYKNEILTKELKLNKGVNHPVFLKRLAPFGKVENNLFETNNIDAEIKEWTDLGMSPTAWIPARVRPMDKKYPLWDLYATSEDLVNFLEPFKKQVWENDNYAIRSGFVVPGMDNRGCGGWGRGHFSFIPRNCGESYANMWQANLDAKDKLDMVFIASWSDYTEGHEIEPTIEHGDRELHTTLKYASRFKDEKLDASALELPFRLFNLRKETARLHAIGLIADLNAKTSSFDAIANLISNKEYKKAIEKLEAEEKSQQKVAKKVKSKTYDKANLYTIKGKNKDGVYDISKTVTIVLDKKLRKTLEQSYYEGYIYFEYLDDSYDFFSIKSDTNRKDEVYDKSLIISNNTNDVKDSSYSNIAEIKTDDTHKWKKAKVKLFHSNIVFNADKDFQFKGKGKVKNISLSFEVFN